MLFTQWLGYSHAITHAGLQTETLTSLPGQSAGAFDHQKANNACAAFDAATLGTSLNSTAGLPLPFAAAGCMASPVVFASWLQVFTPLFASRAPPAIH